MLPKSWSKTADVSHLLYYFNENTVALYNSYYVVERVNIVDTMISGNSWDDSHDMVLCQKRRGICLVKLSSQARALCGPSSSSWRMNFRSSRLR